MNRVITPGAVPKSVEHGSHVREMVVKSNLWLIKLILVTSEPVARHYIRIGQGLIGSV